jgi:hypothetical protein
MQGQISALYPQEMLNTKAVCARLRALRKRPYGKMYRRVLAALFYRPEILSALGIRRFAMIGEMLGHDVLLLVY